MGESTTLYIMQHLFENYQRCMHYLKIKFALYQAATVDETFLFILPKNKAERYINTEASESLCHA